jgi:hypothetical protein
MGRRMLQESPGRMTQHQRLIRLSGLGMVVLLGIAEGCGATDPWNRQAISGVITFDGRPIDDGAVLLEPLANDGSGLTAGATIRRGTFAIARDRGLSPGAYRVRVYSSSGVQAPPGKGQSDRTRRPMVEHLPAIYNSKSELRMDVVAGGPNRLQLDLHGEGGG